MHKFFETMRNPKNLKLILFYCIIIGAVGAVQQSALADTVATTPSASSQTTTPTNIDGIIIDQPVNSDLKVINDNRKQIDSQVNKASDFWNNIYTRAKAAVENSDISANLFSENKNVVDAFNIGVSDRIELSPAYIGGYTLREDSFTPQESFNFLQWFMPNNYPLMLPYAMSQQEIDIWRVFPSYHEATHTRKIPLIDFVAQDLPIDTNVLLNKLRPGTTVRFHVPLNVFVGAQHYFPIGTTGYVQASMGKIFSGEYDVFVFRAGADKARIRLVANRDRDWQEIYKGGLGDQGFSKYFPSHILENIAFGIFKLDDIAGGQVDAPNKLNNFLADYTINLSSKYPEVRKAYDDLFSKAMVFKDDRLNTLLFKVAWPFNSTAKLRKLLISNLTELENIYHQEVTSQPDISLRRVDRNFIGSNFSNGHEVQGHFGVGGIFKISEDTSLRQNELTVDSYTSDGKPQRKYYIFPEWFVDHSHAYFFNVFSENLMRSAFMVYEADKKFQPTAFDVMGFNYQLSESRYGNPANQKVIQHLHNELPPPVFSDLESFLVQNNLWNISQLMRGVRVVARYYVNGSGLAAVEHRFYNMPPDQVFKEILYNLASVVRHADKLKVRPTLGSVGDQEICVNDLAIDSKLYNNPNDDAAFKYCADLIFITTQLQTVANPSNAPEARKHAMDKLAQNNLFREIGPGLIYSVIPPEDYPQSAYVQVKFYLPKQVAPVAYYWPRDATNKPIVNVDLQLIEQILDNERMMTDQTPDLRLNCDQDSITCRKTRFDGKIQQHSTTNSDPLDANVSQ